MSHGTGFNPDYKLPVMPPAKTKEEKNAERLQMLATNKPYMHERPEGMDYGTYRRVRYQQQQEYKKRRSGQYAWISADRLPTHKEIQNHVRFGTPLPKGGLAMGTYRKHKQ